MTSHDPGTPPPDGVELTLHPEEPSLGSARRRPMRLAAVGIASVAVLGAGIFGITTMNDTGGNASPEEAVEQFFDAVDDEDVIGLLESVDPAERTSLRRAVEGALEQTDRGAITDGLDLDGVQGVDLQVREVAHETQRFTDGIAGVDLTAGVIDADFSIDDFAFGRTVRNLLDPDAEDPGAASMDLDGVRVMTVQRDGSWYVSALYTGAEAIRRADDPDSAVPAFGTATTAVGADSPEAAVRDLANAIDRLDVEAMIGLTSPTRAQVLHDYGPRLIDFAEDSDPDAVSVTDVEMATSPGPDGSTLVEVTGYEISFGGEYDTVTHRLEDGCLITSYEYDDPYDGAYQGEEDEYPYPEDPWFPSETSTCDGGVGVLDGFGMLGFGIFGVTGDTITFTVVEEGGRWYIDPLDSLAQVLVGSLEAASQDRFDELVAFWTGAWWFSQPEEFWEACGVDRPDATEGFAAGTDAMDRCIGQLPDDYSGPWYDSGESSGAFGCTMGEGEPCDDEIYDDPIGDCYAEADDAAIEACILAEVEAGRLSPVDACYSMPDGDTTVACMRRGVEDGTIEPGYACRAELDRERQLACMREGVDAGTIAADEMAAFECEVVFESVDGGIEAEMEAYDACLAEIPDE